MTPIDYIRVDADILRLKLSDKAKMLLGLVKSFNHNGSCLKMSNPELAELLCCSENHVGKLLREISRYLRIENSQSRYRRVFYSIQNDGVDTELLNPNGRSKSNSTQSKTIDIIKKNSKELKFTSQFEQARKIYPGTKRGQKTEFEYFQKKHKDWKGVLPLLKPAIEAQIKWRENGNGEFRPAWKGFQSWIYNRCWEMEFGTDSTATPFDEAAAAQREDMKSLAGSRK